MPGRRVYVAGPMRGYRDHNFPAFDRAEQILRRALGVVPINPADIDRREFGYDGSYALDTRTVNQLLQRDLKALRTCDAVVFLPGWRRSTGANLERDMARLCGIPCWELVGDRYLVPDRGYFALPRLDMPVHPEEGI